MYLSKSKYVNGCQCPKILWMNQHMPEQAVSTIDEKVVATGNEVGDLAMGYYGDFVEIPYLKDGYTKMATQTAELLEAARAGGTPNICEATFIYEGNFCMVDILRVEEDGVHLVEVKSSSNMKDYYYDDVAYQYWVLTQCGLTVKSASLMHLDKTYVRQGDINIHGLFAVEDVTEKVVAKQDEVASNIVYFDEYCAKEDEPIRPMGAYCNDPFGCPYYGWCWQDLVHPGVLDIRGMNRKKKIDLYNQGIRTMQDVIDAQVALKGKKATQVYAEVNGLGPIIDLEGIRAFLDGLVYPLYFLDFETINTAIPLYDGTRPYQQVPTQYSLHMLDRPGGNLVHREFLADERGDPMRQVAEALCADYEWDSCSLAWHMSFEQKCIEEMAEAFPDLSGKLMNIYRGIQDLETPFKKGFYYVREMRGSSSIKDVLPALFPDDPELDYNALEGVHHGGEASDAFARLSSLPADEREVVRGQLLRYCELDTYAMVKILDKLCAIVGKMHHPKYCWYS